MSTALQNFVDGRQKERKSCASISRKKKPWYSFLLKPELTPGPDSGRKD